jgi:hypothetical protein
MASLRIKGMAELNRHLDKISGAGLLVELKSTTQKAVIYALSKVPPYPPPPPMSTYRRTGGLGRSITGDVKQLGSQTVGVIGTDVISAPWVIGHKKLPDGRGPQAWMHKGRWWTLRDVVFGAHDGIRQIYRDMIQRLLRSQ